MSEYIFQHQENVLRVTKGIANGILQFRRKGLNPTTVFIPDELWEDFVASDYKTDSVFPEKSETVKWCLHIESASDGLFVMTDGAEKYDCLNRFWL